MKRAIREHRSDFAAILALLVLSLVVAVYVLVHERLRFPFIESSPITMQVDLSTAQAVTPGQGQTVRVSGVQIGEVGKVYLVNGVAEVQLLIDAKYPDLIRKNATALLRPRTGLDDMFIEINPGDGPPAPDHWTIPISNTLPDINFDEVLSALDSDSRQYLDLLVNGAGTGLQGNGGNELAQVLERFEPTHQDLARVNQAVAVRGTNLQRLVNSLQRLNTALAAKQTQIVSLIDASERVFRAFASEDTSVSSAIALLPGTLRQTTQTLGMVKTFADQLGPTARNLLDFAAGVSHNPNTCTDCLPAANEAVASLAAPSTPIIQNQIRPFVVDARPLVRNLRPAAINLADPTTVHIDNSGGVGETVQAKSATTNLTSAFNVLNHFVNLVGYNTEPRGQHNYLWWLAWLNHNARTLFSVQDANGVFRPLFLQASCSTYSEIVNGLQPSLAALLNPTISKLCNLP